VGFLLIMFRWVHLGNVCGVFVDYVQMGTFGNCILLIMFGWVHLEIVCFVDCSNGYIRKYFQGGRQFTEKLITELCLGELNNCRHLWRR
jgi:hypothetical protein